MKGTLCAGRNLLCWMPEKCGITKCTQGKKNHRRRRDRMAGKIWTDEELAILKAGYPTEGFRVTERLPGRTRSMVAQKARSLHLSAPADEWNTEELNILKKWYPSEGSEVAARLPGKTRHAIRAQAQRVGLSNKARWSEAEDEIIRTWYPTEGPEAAGRLHGRTRESVRIHAQKLGISCEYSKRPRRSE